MVGSFVFLIFQCVLPKSQFFILGPFDGKNFGSRFDDFDGDVLRDQRLQVIVGSAFVVADDQVSKSVGCHV